MFFIPAELYVMCILTWVFLYVFLKIEAKLSPKRKTIEQTEVSATKQALFVGCSALVYALFILISLLLNNATLNFVVMMIVFVLIFCFGVSVTIMFFKQVMGPFRNMVGKVSPKAEVKFDISHTITTSENPDTSCNTISQSHLQNKDWSFCKWCMSIFSLFLIKCYTFCTVVCNHHAKHLWQRVCLYKWKLVCIVHTV